MAGSGDSDFFSIVVKRVYGSIAGRKKLASMTRSGLASSVLKVNVRKGEAVTGVVLRIQRNGYGVVKLDNGKEAYFDRFGVSGKSVKLRGILHEGDKVVAEAESPVNGIAKLRSVAHA